MTPAPAQPKPQEGAQQCRGECGRVLPLSEFSIDRHASNGRQSLCPQCHKARKRINDWRNKHGVGEALAKRCLLVVQGEFCPLCRTPLPLWEAWLDVVPESREVRGILHGRQCLEGASLSALREYTLHPPMRHANGGRPVISAPLRERLF